jgi:GNAT superfamily N-acetyltransferase
MRANPDTLLVYVAYVDGIPVSSARLELPPNNPFAGLWGGSTLPEYRNRGIYTALVATRVQEAQRRGARFVTVDALPTSRPILEKLGFVWVADTVPYLWHSVTDAG